ncbi:MAG TPA: cyclopropane-fatty-acyl-phospholipid synthase family protein, partial [Acetobacteraceae bacterium]|nr:cyclopropane-fatty-acyl-phospholipid synthase family protein [Acetobacteraceae bacterium]
MREQGCSGQKEYQLRILLDRFLKQLIRHGRFSVVWPDGSRSDYGDNDFHRAAITISSNRTVLALALNPALAIGEAYVDETLKPLDCSLQDVLVLMLANANAAWRDIPLLRTRMWLARVLRPLRQANNARRARRNIALHYDLSGRLYSLFLDRDRQYSCGYFPRGDESIDEAQAAKKRHIAAKLKLDRPNLTVLDIGCGWGGMALTLARDYGAIVTGITLSAEQLDEARARAAAEGLSDRVTFELLDYRAMDRQFDRIVSVGMFEHVGRAQLKGYFSKLRRLLRPGGLVLNHGITAGGIDNPELGSGMGEFIEKYIFPGGELTHISNVLATLTDGGLEDLDVENLRPHYARTLWAWSDALEARLPEARVILGEEQGERSLRAYRMYLAGCAMGFEHGWVALHQVLA